MLELCVRKRKVNGDSQIAYLAKIYICKATESRIIILL